MVIPDQIAAVTKEANLLGAAVTCNDAPRLISAAAHDLQTHDDWHAGQVTDPGSREFDRRPRLILKVAITYSIIPTDICQYSQIKPISDARPYLPDHPRSLSKLSLPGDAGRAVARLASVP